MLLPSPVRILAPQLNSLHGVRVSRSIAMAAKRASADDFEEGHEDHVSSTALPGKQPTEQFPESQKPNAFTELMRAKPKIQPTKENRDEPSKRTTFFGRDGLAAYTVDPASFPQSRVIYYNDKFTVINDLYPKASVHVLILPREPAKNVQRGQEAFDDPQFLEDCRQEEQKVRKMVAEELRRRFGKHSSSEQARIQAIESDDPPAELPPGRDWAKEVISGTHANPSMNHLHIHVLSRDMVSEPMKKSNHYLSFTTDFFIGLDQYPLPSDDHRRNYKHFPEDMYCWRCGKNFGRKMAKLKDHLAEEFEEWKKE
ncbi:Aprataxin-like protein [Pseudocercospora fuligena]|uniref:Aprataxin-like protein n=1 Tax=Pseudocercospora fuligena TaxID=685502 RepID=A0A8H6RA51_9PEZI|nr:Aprataxin-like protein [Pseudocercospora fuligena]